MWSLLGPIKDVGILNALTNEQDPFAGRTIDHNSNFALIPTKVNHATLRYCVDSRDSFNLRDITYIIFFNS